MNNKVNYSYRFLDKIISYWPYIVLITIGVIAHHQWFTNLGLFGHGDFSMDGAIRLNEFIRFPQLWSDISLGNRDIGIVFWLLYLIPGLLSTLGISPALIERILFLWPIALLTPIFMYLYANLIFKNKIAATTTAIAYSYNIPIIVMSTGILTSHVAVTFTPLLFYYFTKFLENTRVDLILICALIILIIGSFDFRFLYLVSLLLIPYTLVFLIKNSNHLPLLLYLFFLGFLILLLNLYWIPNLFLDNFGSDVFSRGLWGGSFVDLMRPFFLFIYIWTGDEMVPFVNQRISLTTLPIPVLAFLGLYFYKRTSLITYFAIVSLVGIFLVKLNNPPFPEFYEFLYLHFPGFGAFRDSSKFYFFIYFGYSILIGALVSYLSNKAWSDNFLKKIAALIFIALINLIFLINTIPLINGKIDTTYIERIIPDDYIRLNEFIAVQKSFFRQLYIPRESRWGLNTSIHPKIGLTELVSNSPIAGKFHNDFFTNSGETFYSPILNANFIDFLRAASVKYIVVPIRDAKNNDDFFVYYGNNRERYVKLLSDNKNLSKVNLDFVEIIVYEVNGYSEHITLTDMRGLQHKLIYSCQNPTRCNFSVPPKIDGPFYIEFSNRFDPNWNIYFDDGNLTLLPNESNLLKDVKHSASKFGFNRFYFDEAQLSKIKRFENNLMIFYEPQKSIIIGSLISLITFFLILITLIFLKISFYINRRKNK